MSDTDIDTQLQELFDKVGELSQIGHYASASRVYGEIRRLAKGEERVVEYMLATFHQADIAANLLQPAQGRDLAVELIALVESEDRARAIQANLPSRYDATVGWMTTCVYDKLADGTAMVEGYNSPGMHESLQEGIQVCRRAGKLECIKCFREYAVDVYRAADDLEMALHNARIVGSGLGPETVRGDRRWLGTNKEARITLLTGRLPEAEEVCRRSLELAETYHTHVTSHIQTSLDMEQILLLAGRHDELGSVEIGGRVCAHFPQTKPPIVGEYADLDYDFALRDGLMACCEGDFARAVEILTPWDKLLQDRKFLDRWFDIRLRMVAAAMLMNDDRKAEALASQLEKKASDAQDWLTLRRLKSLRERPFPISPAALPYPLTKGPFSDARTSVAAPSLSAGIADAPVLQSEESAAASSNDDESSSDLAEPVVETPLKEWLSQLHKQWKESDDSNDAFFIDELLSQDPSGVTHQRDAAKLLQLMEVISPAAERGMEIWKWARALVDKFPSEPRVLSSGALLVGHLRDQPESQLQDAIGHDLPENWLKKSLQLDADDWGNFGRAGMFHLQRGNISESERCFARAFRLERKNTFLASRLSEIYSHTDRPRDALAVLDMCLREGVDDASLYFEAAMLAYRLERPQAVLVYFDKFDELSPGQPWVQYYRALSLLDLNRPAEAGVAIEREALQPATEPDESPLDEPADDEIAAEVHSSDEVASEEAAADAPASNSIERALPIAVVRACVAGAVGALVRLREVLQTIEEIRLVDVEELTLKGLMDLFHRLWRTVQPAAKEDADIDVWRARLESRLLEAGLSPDDSFVETRAQLPKTDVVYYVVRIRQPLDDDWSDSPGCLHGQDEWTAYLSNWGVLATDESSARATVLSWQNRCAPLAAEIVQIEAQDEQYRDSPGIVWQGPHFPNDESE